MLLYRDVAVTKQFIESMQKAGTPLGMKFGAPKVVTIADNRPATYVQALNQLIPMKPSIVMIIIPNNKVSLEWIFLNDDVYSLMVG